MSEGQTTPSTPRNARLFISHRHDDKELADVLRTFVKSRSSGRVEVFQSSSAMAGGPRIGEQLNRELLANLWESNMLILIYTTPDQDWSYCMWECGVALDARSPDTRIVLFKFCGKTPTMFADKVSVDIHSLVDVQRFTNEFLTGTSFFPDHGSAISGFSPNGTEVLEASQELYDKLKQVAPAVDDNPDDWPPYPYLQLQFTTDHLRAITGAASADRTALTRKLIETEAVVSDVDSEASRLFGMRDRAKTLFANYLGNWMSRNPDSETRWVDAIATQVSAAAVNAFPTQVWELMRAVDPHDGTWYGPSLIRVHDLPRQRCSRYDVYFCKFSLDAQGHIVAAVDRPPALAPAAADA